MCSHSESRERKSVEATARIVLRFHPLQRACYDMAVGMLRYRYGLERPEWWCLAVMARHFLDVYADADDQVRRTLARQVIQRDNYTCSASECLMRGGLEEGLTVKMGDRLYQKDELLYPRFKEEDLDAEPWGLSEPGAPYRAA